VGACVVLLLGAAITWVVAMSGRTIGRGITLYLEMPSSGPLHTGAKVRLAGEEIGEVRGAVTRRSEHGLVVDFELFIVRSAVPQVRRNADFFVSTPSVLGEAFLEIGPPRDGALPGEPVKDKETVKGAPPPDIDRFFVYAEAAIREALTLMRENKGEFDEFISAIDSLLSTLSGLPADRGQLSRMFDQGSAALEQGRALFSALRDARAVDRVRAIWRELSAVAVRIGPDLRDLGAKISLAIERFDTLRNAVPDDKRAEVREALARFRRAIDQFQKLGQDVRALVSKVERGQGTFGALLADKELFDDLHETHRIIKGMPLRFLLKTVKPKDRISTP
jgi:hypothetical protein